MPHRVCFDRMIELLRLEKTSNTIQLNCQDIDKTSVPTSPRP